MALVLTRGTGDRVVITVPPSTTQRTISIHVDRGMKNNETRLGFTADRDVKILRAELAEVDAEQHRREVLGPQRAGDVP